MTKLHTVPVSSDNKVYFGVEPVWHDITVPVERYNVDLLKSLSWYNYVADVSNCKKFIEEWISVYRPTQMKTLLAAWRIIPDAAVDKSICKIARIQLQGFPLNDHHVQSIENYVDGLLITDTVVATVKNATRSPSALTVQDYIRKQIAETISDLDVEIDASFDMTAVDDMSIRDTILSKGYKGPQLKLIADYLNTQMTEWLDAYNSKDEQLVEGYSYVPRRHFKKIIDKFATILSSISEQQTHIKSQRVTKKKPVDKKKIASKLKFLKEYPALNIKSVSAVDIIGANHVWVYDTKKRKLGYYEAEVKGSMYIKGTMIVGYKNTCVKTLRTPEEQLPNIMSLRKNQTVTWFNTLRTKCGTLTGRTNADLILLRID